MFEPLLPQPGANIHAAVLIYASVISHMIADTFKAVQPKIVEATDLNLQLYANLFMCMLASIKEGAI
jgi:hypothetical protein